MGKDALGVAGLLPLSMPHTCIVLHMYSADQVHISADIKKQNFPFVLVRCGSIRPSGGRLLPPPLYGGGLPMVQGLSLCWYAAAASFHLAVDFCLHPCLVVGVPVCPGCGVWGEGNVMGNPMSAV